MNYISQKHIENFRNYLISSEKASNTVKKYVRDITAFSMWIYGRNLCKEVALEYKMYLTERLMPTSVNSVIASMNCFFDFVGMYECKLKSIKIQKNVFLSKDKELSKREYERLLIAAESNPRLKLVIQTICVCGLRVSEDI